MFVVVCLILLGMFLIWFNMHKLINEMKEQESTEKKRELLLRSIIDLFTEPLNGKMFYLVTGILFLVIGCLGLSMVMGWIEL